MKYLKLLFAGIKALVAIVLSPILLILFYKWNRAFLFLMTALWPHLDILDDDGLYLRRWFFTPKTKWYRPRFLHYIHQSDKGRFPHDHPGSFYTSILRGGYVESIYYPKKVLFRQEQGLCVVRAQTVGTKIFNPEGHTHMVELLAPTWTWVKGWIRGKPWGFYNLHPTDATKDVWIDSKIYCEKSVEVESWTRWF
jgi:hypothetical protein